MFCTNACVWRFARPWTKWKTNKYDWYDRECFDFIGTPWATTLLRSPIILTKVHESKAATTQQVEDRRSVTNDLFNPNAALWNWIEPQHQMVWNSVCRGPTTHIHGGHLGPTTCPQVWSNGLNFLLLEFVLFWRWCYCCCWGWFWHWFLCWWNWGWWLWWWCCCWWHWC